MEDWNNEMLSKSTIKLEPINDSCSDSEEISDLEMIEPFQNHMIKKHYVLTSSSESEESRAETTPMQKERINKCSWTQGDYQPVIHKFNDDNSGIKANINRQSSILNVFQIFFSEELIEYIVEQTNKYYQSSTRDNVHNFNVTTVPEMYNFLAVTMLMARIHKISFAEYWSTNKLIRTESFGEIMSRDRYTFILKTLHFCDENIEEYNPIVKIRPVLEKLRTSFNTAFYPFEKLCIDESLLLFKGRCYFKQHVPSMRRKFGIKSFALRDIKTGYIQDLIVYSGTSIMSEDALSKSIGKSGQVVMTLLEPYLGKSHTLVTHDWYSSPSLFLELHKNFTNAYGMVRKNRLSIPELNKEIIKGECLFHLTKSVLALKWMDKSEVWMISTYHCPNMIDTNKIHHLTKEKIIKPQCIIDYNNAMEAVDKVDQVLYTLNSTQKGLKWYKQYFFHLFDLAVYNTFVLYNSVTGKNSSFSKFHLDLITQILQKYSLGRTHARKSKNKSTQDEPFRLMQKHFPSPYVNDSAIRKNARRKCIVCKKHNRRRETHYECKKCDVGLCIYPCFESYHTLLDY